MNDTEHMSRNSRSVDRATVIVPRALAETLGLRDGTVFKDAPALGDPMQPGFFATFELRIVAVDGDGGTAEYRVREVSNA